MFSIFVENGQSLFETEMAAIDDAFTRPRPRV